MASSKVATSAIKQVKPILSVDKGDAKKRVLSLYKAWYRQIPCIVADYDIPKSVSQCRSKLREEFVRHKNVSDIRVIDMLVVKGQMELKEIINIWKQKGHVMAYWKDTHEPKPKDFISKFLSGTN